MDNPVLELSNLIMGIIDFKRMDYFITLIIFMSRCNMTDNCSIIFENLCKFIIAPECIKNLKTQLIGDLSME